MSATPRPWSNRNSLVRGPAGPLGIVATTLDNPEDAALIVRAVNAFGALLAVATEADLNSTTNYLLRDQLVALDAVAPGWREWTA